MLCDPGGDPPPMDPRSRRSSRAGPIAGAGTGSLSSAAPPGRRGVPSRLDHFLGRCRERTRTRQTMGAVRGRRLLERLECGTLGAGMGFLYSASSRGRRGVASRLDHFLGRCRERTRSRHTIGAVWGCRSSGLGNALRRVAQFSGGAKRPPIRERGRDIAHEPLDSHLRRAIGKGVERSQTCDRAGTPRKLGPLVEERRHPRSMSSVRNIAER